MGIVAGMDNDGNFVSAISGATRNESAAKTKSNSTLDKEAFLQLLVAQMKNQDPLEPQDNSQMVAQMASFSQVEELQNMSSTLTQNQGFDLVGKMVAMNTTLATGEKKTIEGMVDYVLKEGKDIYLGIGGQEYNLDDLSGVIDQ